MIKQLFKNHFNKDIPDSFTESISALLFLSPPLVTDFSDLLELKEEEYNIFDILVYKLLENTRRIYPYIKSIAKNKSLVNDYDYDDKYTQKDHKYMDNYLSLVNQQKNIYMIFDLLKDKLQLNENDIYFEKAIMGRGALLNSFELFCYLGLHQSISEDNIYSHECLIKLFGVGQELDLGIVKDYMKSVMISVNQKSLFKEIFNLIDINSIIDTSWHSGTVNHSFYIVLLEYCVETNFNDITVENKVKLLKYMSGVKLFDLKIFNDFIEDKVVFKNSFRECMKDMNFSLLQEDLLPLLPASSLGTSETVSYMLDFFKTLSNPYYLLKLYEDKLINIDQRDKLLDCYDLSVPVIKKLIDVVSGSLITSRNKSEIMSCLLKELYSKIDKELLAYIISKDSDYMELCKPYFLRLKFNEEIPEKEEVKMVNNKI